VTVIQLFLEIGGINNSRGHIQGCRWSLDLTKHSSVVTLLSLPIPPQHTLLQPHQHYAYLREGSKSLVSNRLMCEVHHAADQRASSCITFLGLVIFCSPFSYISRIAHCTTSLAPPRPAVIATKKQQEGRHSRSNSLHIILLPILH
jgi:hypothetical protein